jgi:23S rRNA (cytidine1920-2'-O)/16S rRNA (cytidine1409-2'-O)-methyltransferase
MHTKQRLDLALTARGLAASRQRAKSLIMAGKVLVNDRPVDKPGTLIADQDRLVLKGEDLRYVSRGGLKLEAALRHFALDVTQQICLDVGASTGGFTDCLLQHGARKVYAVDVGYGQLAWRLRQNPRVAVVERTNIRYMPYETIGCRVDRITVDVSFISLKIVVPAVLPFMAPAAKILALIKPQFEVGKQQVGKGGVVREERLHRAVIADLTDFFHRNGLETAGICDSPILGPKGNREFFALLGRTDAQG